MEFVMGRSMLGVINQDERHGAVGTTSDYLWGPEQLFMLSSRSFAIINGLERVGPFIGFFTPLAM